MDKNKIIYKTTPSYLGHFFTTIFILVTIFGYYFGLHFFILIFTGFLALVNIFNDSISILVYEDWFVFRYSNYFGKLMAIDLVYYYKDLTNFKYSIDRWQATIGQS